MCGGGCREGEPTSAGVYCFVVVSVIYGCGRGGKRWGFCAFGRDIRCASCMGCGGVNWKGCTFEKLWNEMSCGLDAESGRWIDWLGGMFEKGRDFYVW